ncbi:hypothetical protein A674_03214 [Salmonella enterica subsp. enterica serovar Enteritidis str. 2009K1651]|uniref:Uncharacterized protein n=3 Tax=Salmonella enterica I TaxID=59201 RepID=A0A6C6Z2S7_SALPB|nr:hypothetical protein SPAB_02622 [Salmonella enterica subsp. enterica serovar Paratyphi B str. SPB7]EPI68104.1 hypothetical protein A673_03037 [Salmonella enterica subsp. enterica serovar Enteritidis str. 2009K0958]EPI71341.1 hypothetical protein A672_02702 [Salmonella enterica subsp. enterica serovar Enteritidis str. 08-1080]EPI81836.1 hypothetical protein A675_03947 [Salmonella enterica subsp. enterica serovar Enteritidis str. 2009K1726]EPI85253.1 hypothetical protein A674_03214 [Salmonella
MCTFVHIVVILRCADSFCCLFFQRKRQATIACILNEMWNSS